MKVLNILIVTIILLVVTILSAGAGHGTFILAKILYPYTMLLALAQNEIGIITIILAAIEIPLYAYILNRKPSLKYYLLALHILAMIICLNIENSVF